MVAPAPQSLLGVKGTCPSAVADGFGGPLMKGLPYELWASVTPLDPAHGSGAFHDRSDPAEALKSRGILEAVSMFADGRE